MSLRQLHVEDVRRSCDVTAPHNGLGWYLHGPGRDGRLETKHVVVTEGLKEGRVAAARTAVQDGQQVVFVDGSAAAVNLAAAQIFHQLFDLADVDRDLRDRFQNLDKKGGYRNSVPTYKF